MTLREAVSKVNSVRMKYYARAQLLGYLLQIAIYGWDVVETIPIHSRYRLLAQLKKLGIDPNDITPDL